MHLRRLASPYLLFLLILCALPIDAAPPPSMQPSNLRSDILYTTRGEFVQISPMRPRRAVRRWKRQDVPEAGDDAMRA